MRKKTKLLALVMCLALLFTLIQACGSSDSEEEKDIVTSEENESESVVTIEEQILFEQDGIVVTAKEYVTDRIWGDGIKLLIENNSDKSVTVGCNALIVNNYMISDLFVSGVAAGKKANEVMYLSSEELEAAGIDSVGQIEVYFHVYDTDTYETLFDTECVTIQTSKYANMDTTPDDIGMELYNAEGIKIIGKTVDENSFWGTAILLYCENNSGKNVGISVEEMSINGFMTNPLFSSDLEENGIETIEDVELKFHIYDADSYDTIADSEVITFSAQ